MTPWMMIRSILCTPALELKRFNKAQQIGADIVFLDLEDGVPDANKCEARKRVINYLQQKEDEFLVGLRINTLSERSGLRDMHQLIENDARPDILFLPKLESCDEVRVIDRLLTSVGWDTKLCPIIENARSIQRVEDIATCTPRVVALIFGAADFSSDMGIELNWDNLLHIRQRLSIAATAAEVALYDAPFFEFNDDAGFEEECRKASSMGFTGKAILHPKQLESVNRHFRPDKRQLLEAQRIVDAYEAAGGEICIVDGQFIGPPFFKRAKATLSRGHLTPSKT